MPFAKKVELCQKIDAAARARDPRVAQVSVSLAGSWSVIEIVRADGFVATDIRPLVRRAVHPRHRGGVAPLEPLWQEREFGVALGTCDAAKIETEFPGGASASGVALQADGMAVLAGQAGEDDEWGFALARYIA